MTRPASCGRQTQTSVKKSGAPINSEVRAAINRIRTERQLKRSPFLFPSPGRLSKPVSKELARAWLRRAEELAEVAHLDGGAWHPFRRGRATLRKSYPDVDVARTGGWRRCYLTEEVLPAAGRGHHAGGRRIARDSPRMKRHPAPCDPIPGSPFSCNEPRLGCSCRGSVHASCRAT
jgi:hypothetical protein